MEVTENRIRPVQIEEEMKSSYIDYSMSVIVSRALPDVRDGLKPVHRRILVAMNDLSLYHDRPYRKSAKITGDVTGNYHPHGTVAVYDAMVRLVQDFSLRYPLIDGQGNFGSVDGDAAAAERYTEARLNQVAEELLRDLDMDTVDFRPNYDETRQEPVVLPSNYPNLLVNGASGIAVGMATNIPPHNLGEVVNGLLLLIDRPDCSDEDLMRAIPGPDFPTGGIILGRAGIRDCYTTGHGLIVARARAEIDQVKNGREAIIVTEIPYQVNKAAMIERIADLVKGGSISGIADVRDESDRQGMRVVIELKREAQPQVVLNQLYKHTQMQSTFGANLLALKNNRPMVLTLRGLLSAFLEHRIEVIERRSRHELVQAEKRAHILEGLRKALDQLDAVISAIRGSADVEEARRRLISEFELSLEQANAILEMRLQRLTGLERRKLDEEFAEVQARISELKDILLHRDRVLELIRGDLQNLAQRFGDARRTAISGEEGLGTFDLEDLIPEEDMVITISHTGYIKRVPMTAYRSQRRGGRGLTAATTKEEDFVERLFVASTHSYLLLFTNRGRVYWLKVHEIPVGTRQARGRSILNLISTRKEERIAAFLPVRDFDARCFVILATRRGGIKKTPLSLYRHPRRNGVTAILLREGDALIGADLTEPGQDVILATRKGKAIRFPESDARPMGRTATGVRGVRLHGPDDEVVGMVVARDPNDSLLVVTERGFGKRSELADYRITRRGGQGVLTVRASQRNGPVVAIKAVTDQDELMIMSAGGVIIRLKIQQVSRLGRATQGVKLIQLDMDDRVVDVAHLVAEDAAAAVAAGDVSAGATASEAAAGVTSTAADLGKSEGGGGDTSLLEALERAEQQQADERSSHGGGEADELDENDAASAQDDVEYDERDGEDLAEDDLEDEERDGEEDTDGGRGPGGGGR